MYPCVYIAGGTGGIGHAIARKFASYPHRFRILIISRDASRAHKAVQSLVRHDEAQTHSYVVGDVACKNFWKKLSRSCLKRSNDAESIRAMILSGSETQVPLPSVLINAAGFVRPSPFIRSEDADNVDQIEVNLLATMRACRYMAKPLRASKSEVITPSIINVASILATLGGEGTTAYATAKAGLLGLTRSLSIEYARLGIRVNSLLPGFIDTPMTKSTNIPLKNIPLGRLGSPDEVADAALFLALNNYANNCTLTLDGGLSAGGGSLVD